MKQNRDFTRRSAFGLAAAVTGAAAAHTRARRARAQQPGDARIVDLLLVLAVDASGSVSQRRFELQRDGYSAAFRHQLVQRAIASGVQGRVGVTMVQWTGPALQVQILPWSLLSATASCIAFAEAIQNAPRQLFGGGTSISGAIDHGARLLAEAPFTSARRVIDISGDGANNRGRPAHAARDEAVALGYTINGLPILELEPDLDEHYKANVIGGPNAFLVAASTFEEFAGAILKKLVTEIAHLPVDEPTPA